MKRIGYLYDVITPEFVMQQINNACRDKCKRPEVKQVLADKEGCRDAVYKMLMTLDFEFPEPIPKTVYDPHSKKSRDLLIPDFYPWQIIHWCYVQMMKPVFMRGMYPFTYSSIPDRGITRAQKKLREWIDEDPEHCLYVGELDVRKFYDNVNQDVLLHQLRRQCKDERALILSEKLIRNIPQGVPIGNYPSPWFANFNMQPVDHFIKEDCNIPHYIRFMDNMILLSDSKEHIHDTVGRVVEFTRDKLHLDYGPSKQVYPLEPRGIDFLGLVYHRNYTLLRSRNFLALTRQARELQRRMDNHEPISMHEALSAGCRIAFARNADSYKILTKYADWPYEIELRRIVRKAMRKRSYERKHNI